MSKEIKFEICKTLWYVVALFMTVAIGCLFMMSSAITANIYLTVTVIFTVIAVLIIWTYIGRILGLC